MSSDNGLRKRKAMELVEAFETLTYAWRSSKETSYSASRQPRKLAIYTESAQGPTLGANFTSSPTPKRAEIPRQICYRRVDSPPVFNITIFPPNPFHLERDRASYNDPDLTTGFYCYGDPRSWAPLFPSSDKTVNDDSERMVSGQEFLAENATDDCSMPMASEAPRILDEYRHYIIKHPSGDAIIDDNGYKMLLIKFLVGPPDQAEGLSVFHFKRIVDGQGTVLTEREQERLRRYLASAFDVEDEESGQGGKGKKEEV